MRTIEGKRASNVNLLKFCTIKAGCPQKREKALHRSMQRLVLVEN